MNVQMKRIDEIRPYENNPRKNEQAVDAVAASIQEFGFRQPIVIDKNGVIIAGHTRYKAAKSLGLTEVPCEIASDLTDEQAKAYRLADNKSGELASWDYELLDVELEELQADFDMTDFGFIDCGISDEQINAFFDDRETETDHKKHVHVCPQCGCEFE